jgi:O-antigen/teichoic acid export membrane protein
LLTIVTGVAVLSPYLLMSHRPLPAQYSILISPPTNPLSGLYSAFRQRHLYLGVLALATLLADFLPVTLSHVPFSVLETSETQSTCAYLSIAILVIMMVAVAASLAVRWPHMPVDPRTIAGALYYLCDSSVLISFDGLAGVERRDRDWMVKSMCVRYTFGTMIGLNGKERVGIEALDAGDGAGSIRA